MHAVEVMKATGTVEKVDLGSRRVTLLLENGKKKIYKADKSVQNLDQVKVADTLKFPIPMRSSSWSANPIKRRWCLRVAR